MAFYCADELDWYIYENVHKHLEGVKIIAKDKQVQTQLMKLGIRAKCWPAFPKTVIMARHALHKFPCSKIKKIGMRHGPYHFKKMIDKEKYNAFDIFFMTSTEEVKQAAAAGIVSAVAGGFPKLDEISKYTPSYCAKLKKELSLNVYKQTVLFTSTWPQSGMSAIDRWYKELDELSNTYNVLVSAHPFTPSKYLEVIKEQAVYFVDTKNIHLYIALADVVIGDTSSILAECTAFYKPLITFKIACAKRLTCEIQGFLAEASHQIDNVSELAGVIPHVIANYDQQQKVHAKWNKVMFDNLDGSAGKKIAKLVNEFIITAK